MVERTLAYVRSGDGQVAFQTFGAGPIDLVVVDDWQWNFELMWDDAPSAEYYERLASFSRVIMFNRRGAGLSDSVSSDKLRTVDVGVEDLLAVIDAAESERPAVMGVAGGVALATVFAACRPDRVRALVLTTDSSKLAWTTDQSLGEAGFDQYMETVAHRWGTGVMADAATHRRHDPKFVAWIAKMERLTATPETAAAMWRATFATDLTRVLPLVRVPTLVIHPLGFALSNEHLRAIPGARYVEIEADSMWPGTDDGRMADEIEEFLTGTRPHHPSPRVLATVLFTDLVGSTELAARLGDTKWRELLTRHDDAVHTLAARFNGRVVKSLGDGVLATFDGPTRALECALALHDELERVDLRMRAGVHTGEVEVLGDDIGGIAVHVAARVLALAGDGDTLATRTVKDLTAGSSMTFLDHGTHALKGVPDEWQLYAVKSGA